MCQQKFQHDVMDEKSHQDANAARTNDEFGEELFQLVCAMNHARLEEIADMQRKPSEESQP